MHRGMDLWFTYYPIILKILSFEHPHYSIVRFEWARAVTLNFYALSLIIGTCPILVSTIIRIWTIRDDIKGVACIAVKDCVDRSQAWGVISRISFDSILIRLGCSVKYY